MNRTFLVSAALAVLAGPASAEDWLDDYGDGSFDDGSPVTWIATPAIPAEIAVIEGDLNLTLPKDAVEPYVASATALANFESGASIRACMVVSNGPARSAVALSDESTGLFGYVAVLNSCGGGEVELFRIDGTPEITYLGAGFVEWPYGPAEEHYIQLDVFEGVVSVRVWRPGEPFPVPVISDVDTTYSSGFACVAVQDLGDDNCSGDGHMANASSTVRFVHASSTPLMHSGIGDITADGVVGPADLAQLLAAWGACTGCDADLTDDGDVGPADLAELLANWS